MLALRVQRNVRVGVPVPVNARRVDDFRFIGA
jgi:hypothetical protein